MTTAPAPSAYSGGWLVLASCMASKAMHDAQHRGFVEMAAHHLYADRQSFITVRASARSRTVRAIGPTCMNRMVSTHHCGLRGPSSLWCVLHHSHHRIKLRVDGVDALEMRLDHFDGEMALGRIRAALHPALLHWARACGAHCMLSAIVWPKGAEKLSHGDPCRTTALILSLTWQRSPTRIAIRVPNRSRGLRLQLIPFCHVDVCCQRAIMVQRVMSISP
jgi:hypothetical protein